MTPQFVTRLMVLSAIAGTVACDRVTKHLAAVALEGVPRQSYLSDTFRLQYVENTGGFLSLGADLPLGARTVLFTVATGLMLIVVVAAAVRFRWTGWTLLGVAFFVAGGASNWVDRATRGSVIDFMNVGLGPLRTGVFNVADMAILLGVGIFTVAALSERSRT